jgi:hypothetical protein
LPCHLHSLPLCLSLSLSHTHLLLYLPLPIPLLINNHISHSNCQLLSYNSTHPILSVSDREDHTTSPTSHLASFSECPISLVPCLLFYLCSLDFHGHIDASRLAASVVIQIQMQRQSQA